MTRFARATGSKSNNARVVEEATSWSEMKKQLLESQTASPVDGEVQEKVKKIKKAQREEKKDKELSKEWAEFGSDKLLRPEYLDDDVPADTPKKEKKKKKAKVAAGQTPEAAEPEAPVQKKKKKDKLKQTESPTEEVANIKKKKKPPVSSTETASPGPKKGNAVTPKQPKKRRAEKEIEGTDPKRRKPVKNVIYVEGREIEVEHVDGFPVMKEDAKRLRDLRKKMLQEGIPKPEVNKAMKLERRRAEKALSREMKKVCFNCRQPGHTMADCPQAGGPGGGGGGEVCFKCGSTEHKSPQCRVSQAQGSEFKFSTCFVCGESGHIARQCPDNPRGLYPQGGGCRLCGDVTHLKRDCPQLMEEKKDNTWTLPTADKAHGVDTLDDTKGPSAPTSSAQQVTKKNKIIKF